MTSDNNLKSDKYKFKAEITQLLDILVHSLYKERDIFLRELISNASDALTRISFEMLTNQDVLDADVELAVRISGSEDGDVKRLTISDTGIGMSREEIVTNLGTIAQSGAREFLAKIADSERTPEDVIGQFGVGFYSVFMVAKQVEVISKSYRTDEEAVSWVSEGGEEFSVSTADKTTRGTDIIITLKEEADEFADNWKIRQIVKKHSDFVSYPIYVGDEQANQQRPLWRKSTSEATEEEYRQFYQQFTMDFEEPLATIHLSSDAPVHIRALLFIPSGREKSVLNLRQQPGLRLYTHNVMIQDYSLDLLPKWLEFVDGVVDSEDVPLNVSRETIQNTRILHQLARVVRGRVMRELKSLATEKPEIYADFWQQYGRIFKEGLANSPEDKDEILPFFRFLTSKSGEKLVTLQDYREAMGESQENIYYALGESLESVKFSPHLDPFHARDIEVLFMTDPIDPFIISLIPDYEGIALKNVDDPDLELSQDTDEDTDSEESAKEDDAVFNRFIGRCVTILGDRVTEVRVSKHLKSSPVRLLAPENAANREFQRISRFLEKDYEVPKRIFEVNRHHPLIENLAHLVTTDSNHELIILGIEQLYESALVMEGLHPDPASMLPRIQRLLEVATDKGSPTNGS